MERAIRGDLRASAQCQARLHHRWGDSDARREVERAGGCSGALSAPTMQNGFEHFGLPACVAFGALRGSIRTASRHAPGIALGVRPAG